MNQNEISSILSSHYLLFHFNHFLVVFLADFGSACFQSDGVFGRAGRVRRGKVLVNCSSHLLYSILDFQIA